MSKLIVVSIFILVSGIGYFTFRHLSAQKHHQHAHALPVELFNEETRLWGKAVGPIQLRLEFKEQSGNHVTLEGHIRSTLQSFEVEWKLPEGVKLVAGNLKETLQQQSSDPTLHKREIVVDVTWPLEKPHLVLRAAENASVDAFGASTVFNLDPSLADMEKEEIIRAHMQSRGLQKIVK